MDMYDIDDECKENLSEIEEEKKEYLKALDDMVATLTKICNKLEESLDFASITNLLQTLVADTKRLMDKIGKSKKKIEERIKTLEEQESARKTMATVLTV